MPGLEIFTHAEPGFKPMVNFGEWRTAISNGSPVYERKEISSFSRHHETDEVFILIKGSCLLLTAGNGAAPDKVTKTWMESGKMYNVTKGTWHGSIQLPDTTVMIVENRDTGHHNSESRDLPEKISI
jgi:mannose-6-phosphate isomerase-like protein (cupin superfamily)